MEKDNIKKVGIICKRKIFLANKPLIKDLVTFLKKQGKMLIYDTNVCDLYGEKGHNRASILKKSDLALSFGGDGTILKTARQARSNCAPVLGINMGNVGFLTEIAPDKLFESLEKIFLGQYTLDNRFLLKARIYRKDKKIESAFALNEVVINSSCFARLVDMRTEINQRKMSDIRSDGLIIATPTGSTAYSLSAGGPIVHPKLEAMILTPICEYSLASRPIIIPNDKMVTIHIEKASQDIGLTIDGQDAFTIKEGDEIKVKASPYVFKLIRLGGGEAYYKKLRDKLKWGV